MLTGCNVNDVYIYVSDVDTISCLPRSSRLCDIDDIEVTLSN